MSPILIFFYFRYVFYVLCPCGDGFSRMVRYLPPPHIFSQTRNQPKQISLFSDFSKKGEDIICLTGGCRPHPQWEILGPSPAQSDVKLLGVPFKPYSLLKTIFNSGRDSLKFVKANETLVRSKLL